MEPAVYRTQPAEAGRCCGLKSGGEPHALAPNFTDLFVFAFPFSFVVNNASPYLDRLREGESRRRRQGVAHTLSRICLGNTVPGPNSERTHSAQQEAKPCVLC